MTDRQSSPAHTGKQEAIEILRDMIRDGAVIECIYNRIAPLIRGEFPEKGVEKAVRNVIEIMAEDSSLEGTSREGLVDFQVRSLMHDLKRLWEGQLPPEGDNILEQEKPNESYTPEELEAQDRSGLVLVERPRKPKGACQKCGGSGKVPQDEESQSEGFITADVRNRVTCPDCKGTGGCQHKGNVGWLDAENKTGPPVCFDCQSLAERRSGKDRRVGKGRREYDNYGGIKTSVGTFRVDRRRGTDRRKAG